jgi:hypothetical protein
MACIMWCMIEAVDHGCSALEGFVQTVEAQPLLIPSCSQSCNCKRLVLARCLWHEGEL